jgi:hypothetical protein
LTTADDFPVLIDLATHVIEIRGRATATTVIDAVIIAGLVIPLLTRAWLVVALWPAALLVIAVFVAVSLILILTILRATIILATALIRSCRVYQRGGTYHQDAYTSDQTIRHFHETRS